MAARNLAAAEGVATMALLPDAAVPSVNENRAALERLARAHYDFVWRTVRRLGVGGAETDDVVQEVFLVAARHINSIQNERGYLFRTCQFACATARRSAQRRREVVDDTTVHAALDPQADPEERAQQAEARDLLQQLLDGLVEDQRAVFVLFELEQLTMAEIAQMLDVPEGTVASRLRRARELFTAAAKERGLS